MLIRKLGFLPSIGTRPSLMKAMAANTRPTSASPAISPEASSTPRFSMRDFWLSLKRRRAMMASTTQRMTPPTKMAATVSKERYMPTQTSIGLLTCTRMKPMAIRMPTTISGQTISPPTMPCDRLAIRPAWGAASTSPPKPPLYPFSTAIFRSPALRMNSGIHMTSAETMTPIRSPTCMRHGVPPRMCPTFRSCSISPATAAATQMTPATARVAVTPGIPLAPRMTISTAATTRVERVRPEMGLLEEPISPTR